MSKSVNVVNVVLAEKIHGKNFSQETSLVASARRSFENAVSDNARPETVAVCASSFLYAKADATEHYTGFCIPGD